MLKYPDCQQKNHWRHLFLLSLWEKQWWRPHVRSSADSGNVERHVCRALRAMGVAYKQPASPTTVNKCGERWCGRCSICLTAKDRKTEKCCLCSEWVCREHFVKINQIVCDSCEEKSKYRQISFIFLFETIFSCPQELYMYVFHIMLLHEKFE
jgi:hypothetical protein